MSSQPMGHWKGVEDSNGEGVESGMGAGLQTVYGRLKE